MLDKSLLEKFDSQKMYITYDKWPEIANEAWKSKQNPVSFHGINHIVFAGMGGSGTLGDVFASILSKTKIHVNVVKGYLLPQTTDSNSLVIITSVSGNTVETLSILKSARELKSKIIAFSSGGEIERFCIKNKIQHRTIPQYLSPRASFPAYLYTILNVLNSTLQIKNEDVLESIKELEKTNKKINSLNLTDDNPSLKLAKNITKIPLIYYPFGLQSVAIRFKNSLQENVKMHAMIEDVIEASHNSIVAWEREFDVQPILLQGVDDFIKTKERWRILKEILDEKNLEYEEVFSVSGNILTKIIDLIYRLDYTSIYLSILSQIDPSPVKSIDILKKKLESD